MVELHDRSPNAWLDRLLIGLMAGSVGLLMVALLSWQLPLGAQVRLQAGSVAPYTVTSPRSIVYESLVLTEEARARAAQAVPEQYDVVEGRVRHLQIGRSREIIDAIEIIRSDPDRSPAEKLDHLQAITDLGLSAAQAELILDLPDTAWAQVAAETPLAIDRIMREEIRESTLAQARRRVAAVIDTAVDEPASMAVTFLVQPLLRANSALNVERTEELRAHAASEVPVQTASYAEGEVIIRAGDIADAQDVEALKQVGLLQREWDRWTVVRAFLFSTALLVVVGGALLRLRPQTVVDLQEMAILVVLSSLWLLVAKFMVFPHNWLPYLYPLAALSMLVAVLIDLRVAVVVVFGFMLFLQYLDRSSPMLAAYFGVGALLAALALGRAERLTAFLWAGVAAALANLAIVAAYGAPFRELAAPEMIQLFVVAALNGGLAASIALLGYYLLGNLFRITTSLQLTELSRPTHPLLQQLLLKSPGTYHHTIVVSNLAEGAAAAIGADAFLARVGAYYHDIGKTVRPYFFSENMADDVSPHERLDPLTSAQIIVSHVKEGLDLADKYHLPPRLRDCIREHHGRTLVKYFLVKAKAEADDGAVDEEAFRYPGPNPRSKETAILMLADTCEAAVRSYRPATRGDLASLIDALVTERVDEGALLDSGLTLKDLETTKEVFLRVLEGVHHPRITYPETAAQRAAAHPASAAEPSGREEGRWGGSADGIAGCEEVIPPDLTHANKPA